MYEWRIDVCGEDKVLRQNSIFKLVHIQSENCLHSHRKKGLMNDH